MYRFHLAACLLQVKVESLILYDTLEFVRRAISKQSSRVAFK